jgi:hypothetical protein
MSSLRTSPRRLLALTSAIAVLSGIVLVPAQASQAGSVCVVEFADLSGTGSGLGTAAAERFAQSVTGTGTLARSSPAPSRAARAEAAGVVGAQRVVYGTITSVKVTEGRDRQAFVRLTVMVEEAVSGRLLLGSHSEGASAPRKGAVSREELLREAFTNAAESFASYLADPDSVRRASTPKVVTAAEARIQKDTPPPDGSARPAALLSASAPVRLQLQNVPTPDPVVVDIPGGSLDGRRDTDRRSIISDRTLKMLVGGVMFVGLLYLAGTGGIGATRPF